MRGPIKILSVVGARPNFMKIAPLAHEAALRQGLVHRLVHTGQHYDPEMSESFFQELKIPAPDFNLGIGSDTHARQTARIMEAFEPVLLEERPDWVVVVGDVNSTMAATLVAAKLGFRVAHVEAGLRSFDRTMPEEINRVVTDALSDLLFTHSPEADANLLREGVSPEKVVRVGNIMIDTLVRSLERAEQCGIQARLGLEPKEYAYITLHRPSNVDEKETLARVVAALAELSKKLPVVFPLHPRTKARLSENGLLRRLEKEPGIHAIPPVSYIESISLAMTARFVLTDSGGLQEETTFLRVPCLTLRPNTERPVTITQGTNRLTALERLEQDLEDTLAGRHPPRTATIPEKWDGKTAARIIDELEKRA